jgi:hypothetical protein
VVQAEQHAVGSDPQTEEIAARQRFDVQSSVSGISRQGFDPRQDLPPPIGWKA